MARSHAAPWTRTFRFRNVGGFGRNPNMSLFRTIEGSHWTFAVMQLLASDPAPKDGVTFDSTTLNACFLGQNFSLARIRVLHSLVQKLKSRRRRTV